MPSERDQLAAVIADYQACGHCTGQCAACQEEAAAILASDWLAEHDRKIKAEALRNLADSWALLGRTGRTPEVWIRQLADDIEANHAE